nr:hypothetical protein BaRGS_011052 [Batillaria attramentaria]
MTTASENAGNPYRTYDATGVLSEPPLVGPVIGGEFPDRTQTKETTPVLRLTRTLVTGGRGRGKTETDLTVLPEVTTAFKVFHTAVTTGVTMTTGVTVLHEKTLEEKRLEEERSRDRDVRESPDWRRHQGDRYPAENGRSEAKRNGHREPDSVYERDADQRRPDYNYHRPDLDRERDRDRDRDKERDRERDREPPNERDREADSPESLQIRNDRQYYGRARSYPQKQYASAPNSEPSHSRDGSPEARRSQSQPYLRLVFDSDDYHNDSNVSDNDPGVTFDRYSRRATRASVLSKAEELLNRRQSQGPQLYSITESSGETTNAISPPRRKIPVYQGTRKVAFAEYDEEEEEEEEEDEEEAEEGDSERSVEENGHAKNYATGYGRVVPYSVVRARKSRLMQANARMRTTKRRGRIFCSGQD